MVDFRAGSMLLRFFGNTRRSRMSGISEVSEKKRGRQAWPPQCAGINRQVVVNERVTR